MSGRLALDQLPSVGDRFGSLTVIGAPTHDRVWWVRVRCDHLGTCGRERDVRVYSLRGNGKGPYVRRCRHCLKRSIPTWAIPLRVRFSGAKQRCGNPNERSYASYGGRGIEFRFSSAVAAVQYCIEELGWTEQQVAGHDIDRIDNNGHYEPGNLRLVTRQQNSVNQRTTRRMTYGGSPILIGDVPDVVRYLWPEITYSRAYYNTLWHRKGIRTLEKLREHHQSRPRVAGRSIAPDLSVVAKYLPLPEIDR